MARRVGRGGKVVLSEREVRYLLAYYPTAGPNVVAKYLGVSRTTVTQLGRRYGVDSFTPPAGHIPLRELVIDLDVTHRAVWEKAKKAGVLKTRGKRGNAARAAFVPEWWADEYRASQPEFSDEELVAAGWLTSPMFADYIGVGQPEGRKYLSRLVLSRERSEGDPPVVVPYVAEYFRDARIQLVRSEGPGGYKYAIHGQDVEVGRVALERDMREAEGLHTTEQLAELVGISDRAMAARLRTAKVPGVYLPNRIRRKTLHFRLEDVQAAGVLR